MLLTLLGWRLWVEAVPSACMQIHRQTLRHCHCHRNFLLRRHGNYSNPNVRNNVRLLSTPSQSQSRSQFDEPIDSQTYASLFHSCARRNSLQHGIELHRHMILHDPNMLADVFVCNHLVNMYCKCGSLDNARKVFDEMPRRNYVSWTALISGYAQHGLGDECFYMFSEMLVDYRPNEFAFASVISSCEAGDGRRGQQVHALAIKMCLDSSAYVANAMISMYSRSCCGFESEKDYDEKKDSAFTVFRTMEFRNLVTWNSMIAGFQRRGLPGLGIDLFKQMLCSGIGFDRATFLAGLSCLSQNTGGDFVGFDLKLVAQLHSFIIKVGYLLEIEVTSALIKAYSDIAGDVADCYKLFLEAKSRDLISWTGIITAFAEHEPEESFILFRKSCREGVAPDRYMFSSVLKACASLMTEIHALSVHSVVIKYGLDKDTVLANSLIHAYARCCCINLSKKVFDEMEILDLVSWNSMLKAYALYGQAKEALQLFKTMDTKPDPATFVALLSACGHAGLVEEGINIFETMSAEYGIIPQLDHYACMVDVLGRVGRILEAERLIGKMPMEPDAVVWSTLLAACRKHGEVYLADLAAAKLKELDPGNSLSYVQMSNICCFTGRFDEAGLIRRQMQWSRVIKEPGLSWIEIGNHMHEFASGGKRHPQRGLIFAKLDELIRMLKEVGYMPEKSLALHDVEEEQKEEQLYCHSEKLALAFAMMNRIHLRNVIKIIKNIRICVDCHNFMKLSSSLLDTEIIVRDSNRFHHFKSNACSCNDYW